MRQDIEEIGDASAIDLEELLDESVRSLELLADDRFPGRRRGVAARNGDAAIADVHALCERGERRRRAFGESRKQRRMIDKKLQGLVVHRREAVAEESRRAVGENGADEVVAADGLVEDGLAPDVSRQRHRNLVLRGARSGVGQRRRDAAAHRLVRVRAGLRPRVDDANGFRDETRAVGRRRNGNRFGERGDAAANRNVVSDAGSRGKQRRGKTEYE